MIAGAVSLVGSIFSYKSTARKVKTEADAFKFELERKWTARLYEERFRLCPEAFKITGLIRQYAAPEYLPPKEKVDELRKKLNVWAAEAGLFMSRDAARACMELRNAMAKQPAHGEKYSKEQGEKVWRFRNKFRHALRNDIGNVYVNDDNAAAAEYWEVL